jgi:hypothetical protein
MHNRYLPEYDQSLTSGIYNVQFMMFRRNHQGLNALNWWRDRVASGVLKYQKFMEFYITITNALFCHNLQILNV